jgi:hypothetical protein
MERRQRDEGDFCGRRYFRSRILILTAAVAAAWFVILLLALEVGRTRQLVELQTDTIRELVERGERGTAPRITRAVRR